MKQRRDSRISNSLQSDHELMAKSLKLEDYWRQHGIENLFKDLTHALVQRMPADPVLAIVQHLQKKFPKSFKTLNDETSDAGIISKRVVQSLQLRPTLSPRSDVQNDSTSDLDLRRRSLNQSAVSGIAAIPTVGSAFTQLLKNDVRVLLELPMIYSTVVRR